MHKIPNILSSLRIALIPVLVLLVIISSQPQIFVLWVAFTLYIIVSLTDWFDGYWARKYSFVTSFGALLDEIADKLFVIAMLITFVAVEYIQNWHILAVGIIISREVAMPALRQFLGSYNIKVPASIWGKSKTTIQMIALGLIMLTPYDQSQGLKLLWGQGFSLFGVILLWVATALTVFSAGDYIYWGLIEYNKISKIR